MYNLDKRNKKRIQFNPESWRVTKEWWKITSSRSITDESIASRKIATDKWKLTTP